MRKFLCGAVAALILTATGCGGKTEAPAGTGGSAKTAAEVPKPPEAAKSADAPKGPYVTKFRLGSSAGPDGVVTKDGSVFAAGETAHASFEIANTPPDAKIRILWKPQPDGRNLAEEEMPARAAYSAKADTKGWPAGDYVLQIYISSETLNRQNMGLGTATLKIVKERPR